MKLTALWVCFVCCLKASAEDNYTPVRGNNILSRLEKSVAKLVHEHYPDATINGFQNVVHIEHATRLYVTDSTSVAQATKQPAQVVVRGPKAGGVWCDIEYRDGAGSAKDLSPKLNTISLREEFVEYRFQTTDSENHCSLLVTLRIPHEPSANEKQFVGDLRNQLENFGTLIDRQTAFQTPTPLPALGDKPSKIQAQPRQ